LTGGVFQRFASTSQGAPATVRVTYAVSDRLTVYSVVGLMEAHGYAAVASTELAGTRIVGGFILLDRTFEQGASAGDNAHVRSHELGHAVGFSHTSRRSVMSITSGAVGITDWDLQAMAVAYARAPGNRSPDVDSDGVSPNRAGRRWTTPTGYRLVR
jgi:hypothetical protein